MSTEALDLLGRKLGVGDHVVFSDGGILTEGFIEDIAVGTLFSAVRIRRTYLDRFPIIKRPGEVCAIVLPGIQDPEVQLAD